MNLDEDETKFINHPGYSRQFLKNSTDMIFTYLQETLAGKNKVIETKLPNELLQIIDFKIPEKPDHSNRVIETCKLILQHSIKTYNPGYHNTLFGGFDEFSLLGNWMMPCVNNSMYTYEMSPCFTLMEAEFYEMFRKILGWEEIDGTMTPGGSFGNILAMQTARFRDYPELKKKGVKNLPNIKAITSDVSHYSIKKGAVLIGLGLDNVLFTKTDQLGRMDVQDLQEMIKKQINQGNKPFFVNATIGSTVEGSIDDVEKISQICQKYKVWLHVDACYGGVFLVCSSFREKLGSMKKIDSITWNPHKGLPIPLQASFFLCRHPGIMEESNSTTADYLFHKERASYSNKLDQGNKVFQCGRIADILKVWTYFKGNGLQGAQQYVNKKFELVDFFKNYLLQHPERFKLVMPEVQLFNVCFWIIPENLKKEDWNGEEYKRILNKLTVLAKKIMMEEGKIMVGYSSTKGSIYFWRIVFANPFITKEQIIQTANLLVKYSEEAYKIIIKEEKEK